MIPEQALACDVEGTRWHEPVVLDARMGYGDYRKVAISTNGAAIAAWGHHDPAWPREPNGLWFSRREPGAAAWTAPTYLDVGEGEYLLEGLQLAVDAAGNAALAIRQGDGDGGLVIRAVRLDIGGKAELAAPFEDPDPVISPNVAMSESGDIVLVWSRGLVTHARVYRAATGAWLPEATIHTGVGVGWVPVVVDRHGMATVVWMFARESLVTDVVAARLDLGTARFAERVTLTGPNVDAQHHRVAIDDLGTVTVVWEERFHVGATSHTVYASRFDPAHGAWDGPVRLGAGISPEVAAGSAGRTIVVWRQGGNLAAAVHGGSDGWDPPFIIHSEGERLLGAWAAAVDRRGCAAVVWSDWQDEWDTHVIRLDTDTQIVGAPLDLGAGPSNELGWEYGAELAAGPGGETSIIWLSQPDKYLRSLMAIQFE